MGQFGTSDGATNYIIIRAGDLVPLSLGKLGIDCYLLVFENVKNTQMSMRR